MTREKNPSAFEYDIALSFANDAKAVAEEISRLLLAREITVFRDEYTGSELWGKDILDHLVNLYARKACYCVLLISTEYPLKRWTESEKLTVQERALRDANEYVLPIQVDDTDIPGILHVAGYKALRQDSLENLARWLEEKVSEAKSHSGPPSKSHDLRSGNVPKTS